MIEAKSNCNFKLDQPLFPQERPDEFSRLLHNFNHYFADTAARSDDDGMRAVQ